MYYVSMIVLFVCPVMLLTRGTYTYFPQKRINKLKEQSGKTGLYEISISHNPRKKD